MTLDQLRKGYEALKKDAAPGVMVVTWREYETGVERPLPTFTVVFIVARIGHNPRAESTFRKLTEDNDRWVSRHWRTRLFNRPW